MNDYLYGEYGSEIFIGNPLFGSGTSYRPAKHVLLDFKPVGWWECKYCRRLNSDVSMECGGCGSGIHLGVR